MPCGTVDAVLWLLFRCQCSLACSTVAFTLRGGTIRPRWMAWKMGDGRASFSVALNAARNQVVRADGVITAAVVDLVGEIGRAVPADPLPPRRVRVCPWGVKRAISKHRAVGRMDRANYRATVSIAVPAGPGLTPA